MEQLKKQVCDYIESHEEESVKFLKRLIQEKSVSGDESGAQAIVIEKLRELGLELDIWEPSFSKMKIILILYHPVEVFQIAQIL